MLQICRVMAKGIRSWLAERGEGEFGEFMSISTCFEEAY